MRRWIIPLALILLIALIQRPLWFSRGGWFRVDELQQQLDAQQEKNRALEARNAALAAEVQDLKSGQEAVEERARFDLGLTRKDEYFVHLPNSNTAPEAPKAAAPQKPTAEASAPKTPPAAAEQPAAAQ